MPKSLSFKPVFTTDFFTIEESRGDIGGRPYYRMVNRDAVVCCPLTQRGELIVVRQLRPNLGRKTLEFPAGGVEAGEEPLAAMRRELMEETALSCDLLPVGKFHLMINRTTHYVHAFLGFAGEPVSGRVPEQGVELAVMSRPEFVRTVMAEKFDEIGALGVLQSASIHLGLDVLTADIEAIRQKFYQSSCHKRPQ